LLTSADSFEGSEKRKKRIFTVKRIVSTGFVALLLAIAALVMSASNVDIAHAATMAPRTDTRHCASLGNLIESDPIQWDTTVGYLKIYYNSSNGYNCAETVSNGASKPVDIGVYIYACAQTHPGGYDCTDTSHDQDYGKYSHYAGPVGVHAPGHCIQAIGTIILSGDREAGYRTIVSHCG
jgi:hypothetical protein